MGHPPAKTMSNHLLPILLALAATPIHALTIDRMVTAPFGQYIQTYDPAGYVSQRSFMIFGPADYYVLDDGTQWDAGAGSHPATTAGLQSVEVAGGTITYNFLNPPGDVLFRNTDYDGGNHSAQGVLGVAGPLQIIADVGARTGTMTGYTRIVSNDATWYGEPRFNYYSAGVGDLVWFQTDFVLYDAVWEADLFGGPFRYSFTGMVDFTRLAIPEPATAGLLAIGLALAVMRTRRDGADGWRGRPS